MLKQAVILTRPFLTCSSQKNLYAFSYTLSLLALALPCTVNRQIHPGCSNGPANKAVGDGNTGGVAFWATLRMLPSL